MKKIAVAGKVSPELYKKIEQFQKKQKIKTKSQALELILTEYFSPTANRQVTERLPKEKAEGNSKAWLISELEQIEAHIEGLKKEVSK
jgi:hypothetical protein